MHFKKIVIASDSYKGCLSSAQVADAAKEALSQKFPDCEVVSVAVADGGEGTVEALIDSLKGELRHAIVSDPLGRPVKASYGVAGDLAIIESAAACGLTLLDKDERNPLITSTKGLGELIVAAIDSGCRRFLVGLGGSATNDGGMGMIGADSFLEKARNLKFTIACDVDTPYVGPFGASRVFGPQKGASPSDVEVLEKRLCGYAEKIYEDTGVDVRDMPGAGAAGGLGGAFRAYLNADLKRGVDMVLDQIAFDAIISDADLVITGEGCSDFQTLKGKTASGVLARARAKGVPVALVSGAIRDAQLLREGGFDLIKAVTPEDLPLSQALIPEVAINNIKDTIIRMFSDE